LFGLRDLGHGEQSSKDALRYSVRRAPGWPGALLGRAPTTASALQVRELDPGRGPALAVAAYADRVGVAGLHVAGEVEHRPLVRPDPVQPEHAAVDRHTQPLETRLAVDD